MAYHIVIDGTNVAFKTWCWWTRAQRENRTGNGTPASSLIDCGQVTITSVMDALVDAILDTKWEYEAGVPIRDIQVIVFFDKDHGSNYTLPCSNGYNSLSVSFVDDADPEIVTIVSNSWVTHPVSDIICIITDDSDLTELIYEAADEKDHRSRRPIIIVEKADAEIEGVPIIPLHINIRRSHGLYKAGLPFLHLTNPARKSKNRRRKRR